MGIEKEEIDTAKICNDSYNNGFKDGIENAIKSFMNYFDSDEVLEALAAMTGLDALPSIFGPALCKKALERDEKRDEEEQKTRRRLRQWDQL